MTPLPLNRNFIGISVAIEDYSKVKGLLPTPSYQDTTYSRTKQSISLIYAIDGFITSAKQNKWLSDIKLSLRTFLFIAFDEVSEFHITNTTECNSVIYSLDELRKAFKASYHTYPNIYYPGDKKSLYRHLVIHGKKLRRERLFTLEALTSAGLLMNEKLESQYSSKELHKKIKGAYLFILENEENFKEKLPANELSKAHSRGAKKKNHNQAQRTKQKIVEALKNGEYLKPNGKVNKTALANTLGINRRTLDNYL